MIMRDSVDVLNLQMWILIKFSRLTIEFLLFSVNGNWGSWGKFGPPTKNCDEGFRTRTRLCNNPFPRGGGKSCEGRSEESYLFEFGRCVLSE